VALGLSPQPGGEHLTPVKADVDRVATLRPRYEALRELAVQASAL
jgi:gluconokinase